MSLLEVRHLKKVYTAHFGGVKAVALADIEFSVDRGEYVAIMGESGSGKTTLLNILAALDKPTSGSIMLDGKDMSKIPDSRMAAYRRDNLGFVFQDFNLLDTFSIKIIFSFPWFWQERITMKWRNALRLLQSSLKLRTFWKNSLTRYPADRSRGRQWPAL